MSSKTASSTISAVPATPPAGATFPRRNRWFPKNILRIFARLEIILRIFTVGNKLQNIIQNKNNLIDISKKIKDLKVKELNINDIKNNSHSNEGIDKIVNDLENEYNIIEENKGNGNRNENEGINNFEEVKNEGSIQNDNKINDNDNNNNYDDNFDDD